MYKTITLIAIAFFTLTVNAQITEVSGDITTNTVWQDTIHIIDTVTVLDNITLTVTPGTVINFKKKCTVNIYGTFYAVGNDTNNIVFKNDSLGHFVFDNSSAGANGAMDDNDTSRFEYWYLEDMQQVRAERFVILQNIKKFVFSNNTFGGYYRTKYAFIQIIKSNAIIGNNSFKVNTSINLSGVINITDTSNVTIHNNVFDECFSSGNIGNMVVVTNKSKLKITNSEFNNSFCDQAVGLYAKNTDTLIINNSIYSNLRASLNGEGLYLDSCKYISINNSKFYNNGEIGTSDNGGAIYTRYTNINITNCIFNANEAQNGAALYLTHTDFNINNSLITNNTSFGISPPQVGGAIYIGPVSQGKIINSTIANNVHHYNSSFGNHIKYKASGIAIASTDMLIQNSIIYGNNNEYSSNEYQIKDYIDNAYPIIKNCILDSVSGGVINTPSPPVTATAIYENCTDTTPDFVQGYIPSINSFCIDAGLYDTTAQNNLPNTDLAGDNRVNGTTIDIGAYEYNNSMPSFAVTDTTMYEDSTLTLQVCISDIDTADNHYITIQTDTSVVNVANIQADTCGYTYTLVPKPNYYGNTEVQINITDSTGTSNESLSQSFNLQILNVNDAPEIVSISEETDFFLTEFNYYKLTVDSVFDIDNTTFHYYFEIDNDSLYIEPDYPIYNYRRIKLINGYYPDTLSVNVKIIADDVSGGTDTAYISKTIILYDGINTITNNNSIKIYPNPAKDNIQLSISNKQLKINSIEIIDTYGKNVKQLAMDNYQLSIDISDLEKGMYIIKINTDKHIYTKTFIKN